MRVLPGLAGLAGLALAAAWRRRQAGVVRILRVSRVVADLERAVAFYREGLGFRVVSEGPGSAGLAALLGLPGVGLREVVLRLGADEVALVRFDRAGAAYPAGSRSDDCWFQHLAIVVSDMEAAYRQLSAVGCEPVSTDGPQVLPPRNGGVVAFKFRDPDGHPLELIHFPPGQGRDVWHQGAAGPFLGIDHSAMAVSGTARSVRHYRGLGFRVADRSWNHGPAQAALDGLAGAEAHVTGLRPAGMAGPGLELLGYVPAGRRWGGAAANDVVTDWVTVERRGHGGRAGARRDPDGHLMVTVSAGRRGGR